MAEPDHAALVAAARDGDKAAFAALPPGQRAAVRLHYLAGLTQAQTATEVGTSAGAIRVQLHQARARLRQRLGPWRREERMPVDEVTGWVEMRVEDVRRAVASGDKPERNVVLLEEVGGDRRLLIWVGPFLLRGGDRGRRGWPAQRGRPAQRRAHPGAAGGRVSDRLTDWERSREAMAKGRERDAP